MLSTIDSTLRFVFVLLFCELLFSRHCVPSNRPVLPAVDASAAMTAWITWTWAPGSRGLVRFPLLKYGFGRGREGRRDGEREREREHFTIWSWMWESNDGSLVWLRSWESLSEERWGGWAKTPQVCTVAEPEGFTCYSGITRHSISFRPVGHTC